MTAFHVRWLVLCVVVVSAVGCQQCPSTGTPQEEGEDAGTVEPTDAALVADAGETVDAAELDASVPDDAAEPADAGEAEDASGPTDAGDIPDAGTTLTDAAPDASSPPDAAIVTDAATLPDAAITPDAATPMDAATPADAATPLTDAAVVRDAAAPADAATPLTDAAVVRDAAAPADAATPLADAAVVRDAAAPADAATALDAATVVDAAPPLDAAAGPDTWFFQGPENTTQVCTDGQDNDGDGYRDCKDFDCRPVPPCNIPENSPEACTDGWDNDGDTYVDCVDWGCSSLSVCQQLENTVEACQDHVDNNHNNLTDCDDPECQAFSICSTMENSDATCSDGVDNDKDNVTDCMDPGCSTAAPCQRNALRLATFNVQGLSLAGTDGYLAALALIRRIDADTVCFNEIEEEEAQTLTGFAAEAGYPYLFKGAVTTAMAGGIANACLSRLPIVMQRSLSSDDISLDYNANETGRDIVMIRVEVVPARTYVGIFSVHFKSGFEDADYFRRTVESIRAGQAIQQYRQDHPDDVVAIMGDFNEDVWNDSLGRQFTVIPDGMPLSYRLGSDLLFPLTYHPFQQFTSQQMAIVNAYQEDSSNMATRIPSNRRIDYIIMYGATEAGSLVYNPCLDNGVDDAPPGHWVVLEGEPVACGQDELASDHRPVLVDLMVQ